MILNVFKTYHDSGDTANIKQAINQVYCIHSFCAHVPGGCHVCPCFFHVLCRRRCAWKSALRWCGASNWAT